MIMMEMKFATTIDDLLLDKQLHTKSKVLDLICLLSFIILHSIFTTFYLCHTITV